jgi:hypothetical protein
MFIGHGSMDVMTMAIEMVQMLGIRATTRAVGATRAVDKLVALAIQ